MKRSTIVAIALLALPLAGCRGKLTGTAVLTGPGTAETTFTSSGKKKISLWADTDGKWRGGESSKIDVSYEVDVLTGGKLVAHLSCPTGNTSICGTQSTTGNVHDADCELSLTCEVPALPAGEHQLKVTGKTGPNVIEVKKMSLNVREK